MTQDTGTRLVALIENIGSIDNPNFKIINFLSDVKIVKDMKAGIHLKDEEGRYLFNVECLDVHQIPYGNDLKDVTVIVGKNGAGKTRLIKKIVQGKLVADDDFVMVYENNKKFWLNTIGTLSDYWSYNCNFKVNNQPIDFANKSPYIIRFSNAEEFREGLAFSNYDTTDARDFKKMFRKWFENNENISAIERKKILDLRETSEQVKFIQQFEDEISKFVNYTKKGVAISFSINDILARDIKQRELISIIEDSNKNKREKTNLNQRLVKYYSLLINHIIDTEYDKLLDYEELLELHLRLQDDSSTSDLQYEVIGDKYYSYLSSVPDFGKSQKNQNNFYW